jgi:hypothetical protein
MNKSIVEWFANRISHGGLVTKKQFNELLEQAKEMEEEQRKKDFRAGWHGNKHKDWNCEFYLQGHLTNQFQKQENERNQH